MTSENKQAGHSDETWVRFLIQISLLVMIVFGAVVLTVVMVKSRKPPAKQELREPIPLVDARRFESETLRMTVEGYGTVEPRIMVQLVPQVSGKVVEIREDFVNGGFFAAGETLIGIDPRDYELAVESARADVARAEVTLDTEKAEAQVARQEWEALNPGREPDSPLVLREPQIRQAQAQLEAAQANLDKAQLSLERTVLTLPFDGRVMSENVEKGQFLNVGQSIATVYGTDVVEIVVPLEDPDLAWFDVPLNGNGDSQKGSPVEVITEFAGQPHVWEGRVVRMEGQIDRQSRVVNVVVEVQNPYHTDGRPPLVPGMFVEVRILGREVDDIFRIPRYIVHRGEEVWVAKDGLLHITPIHLVRQDREYSYIRGGLSDGDVLVTSPLDTVTDRMKIRVDVEQADTQEAEPVAASMQDDPIQEGGSGE